MTYSRTLPQTLNFHCNVTGAFSHLSVFVSTAQNDGVGCSDARRWTVAITSGHKGRHPHNESNRSIVAAERNSVALRERVENKAWGFVYARRAVNCHVGNNSKQQLHKGVARNGWRCWGIIRTSLDTITRHISAVLAAFLLSITVNVFSVILKMEAANFPEISLSN